MWNMILPALIAAAAALGGVTVGALVEPWKLSAARRARGRQERLDRCAQLVELAHQVRGLAIGFNRAYWDEQRSVAPGAETSDEIGKRYYGARTELRTVVTVLRIYGPDDLAKKAEQVRQADGLLAYLRFSETESLDGRPIAASAEVRSAAAALNRAVDEFAELASTHVR
jgi:hypothetical protein